MKNYFVIAIPVFITLFFFGNNSYSQSDDHINAVITGIPHEILAGQTAEITVTVTNKTKDTYWSSSQLKMEVTGPFTVVNQMQSERAITLEPGQSGNILLTLTPTAEGGKQEFTIILYNNDIKLARETKNIEVLAVTRSTGPTEIKPTDDDVKKDDDKGKKEDDDKDKGKNKDKDKDKDKDKGNSGNGNDEAKDKDKNK
jgi:hypothetical protein